MSDTGLAVAQGVGSILGMLTPGLGAGALAARGIRLAPKVRLLGKLQKPIVHAYKNLRSPVLKYMNKGPVRSWIARNADKTIRATAPHIVP